MALMLLVAAVGLTRMAENNLRMETIVDQYNVKTGYLVTMYNVFRSKSLRHIPGCTIVWAGYASGACRGNHPSPGTRTAL